MNLRISNIVADSYVDGPEKRTAVFFQGCSIHCPGCQNGDILVPAGMAGAFEEVGDTKANRMCGPKGVRV